MASVTGDASLLKRINRMALVRLVKAHPGFSRAELSKETGLTKSTVSVLVGELVAEGWLREEPAEAAGALGRRPTPLTLDPDHLALLGAEVGVSHLEVVACSLRGEVIWSRRRRYAHGEIERSIDALARMLELAVSAMEARGCKTLGLGVALPGAVHGPAGRLLYAPNIGWHDVDVAPLVRAELEKHGHGALPVSVMNDANAAAVGEHVFVAGRGDPPLVYLHLGVGLGGGIVLGERLHLGHDGFGGEVGHTILHPEGPLCACGGRGCAEAFVSWRAVSAAITGPGQPLLAVEEIARRLARGDATAVATIERASSYLGQLMQNLCYTLNPARIVLGGPLAELGPQLVDAGVRAMHARGWRYGHPGVAIARCAYGLRACAVGAAGAVFQTYLQPLDEG